MLSAVRRTLDLVGMQMQDIPAEDPATYEMICRADTIGVFQIESRAQMAMLPRLPATGLFLRPGDRRRSFAPARSRATWCIPYLRRRIRRTGVPLRFSRPELEDVLGRTCGVPIFQEQAMQLAVVAAGFTPGEADQLRRAMGAWRRWGGLGPLRDKLLPGAWPSAATGRDRRAALPPS